MCNRFKDVGLAKEAAYNLSLIFVVTGGRTSSRSSASTLAVLLTG